MAPWALAPTLSTPHTYNATHDVPLHPHHGSTCNLHLYRRVGS